MLPFLLMFLTFIHLSATEPVIHLSFPSHQPVHPIKQIFQKIPSVDAERMQLGLDPVIDLSIGQPHIPMQMQAIDALIEYLESLKVMPLEELCSTMGYGSSRGIGKTKELIGRLFSESYPEVPGGFLPEEVMIANGATGSLDIILNVLIEEGDEVAILAPYYSCYEHQVRAYGGSLVAVPFLPGRSNIDLLDETLRCHPKVKAFLWNDPNNPLGTKASIEDLKKLAQVIEKYPNLIVIHDEIYKDIAHEEESRSLLNIAPELKARSFVIRCVGKDILGAPAIRGGLIAAPTSMRISDGSQVNFIKLMSDQQFLEGSGPCIFVQKIVGFAIEQKLSGSSKQWEATMRKEYMENTKLLAEALEKIGLKPLAPPRGAFYVMVDGSSLLGKSVPNQIGSLDGLNKKIGEKIQNDMDIAAFFLHVAGVTVIPGSSFGTDLCSFRVSSTKPKAQLIEAVQRMEEAIEHLE